MLSFRLPTWVYWTLAGLGVVAAGVITAILDFSRLEGWQARRLLFTVWGGPLTLVVAASLLATGSKRSTRCFPGDVSQAPG